MTLQEVNEAIARSAEVGLTTPIASENILCEMVHFAKNKCAMDFALAGLPLHDLRLVMVDDSPSFLPYAKEWGASSTEGGANG